MRRSIRTVLTCAFAVAGVVLLDIGIADAQMCQMGGGGRGGTAGAAGGGRVAGGGAMAPGGAGGASMGQMMQMAQQMQMMRQQAALNVQRQQSRFQQIMLARQNQSSQLASRSATARAVPATAKPTMSRRERLRALIAERRGDKESQGLSRRELTLRRSARIRAEREATTQLVASTTPSVAKPAFTPQTR